MTAPISGDFLWGVATSSYQIEGQPLADGAAPSNWHRFSHRRGKIHNNDNGDLACDHYRRWPEDVQHLAGLGVGAYRFSVAWPRIVPEPGRVNSQGLAFYDRLVDALLERGIRPLVTIFHWDLPAWLEDRGGFTRPEALEHLDFYGQTLFRALGDRVQLWNTINEPLSVAAYGYLYGTHPPGRRLRLRQCLAVSHHLLLGHARLVRLFRQMGGDGAIGITEAQIWVQPLDPADSRDVAAAERMDQLANRLYIDPLFFGRYPEWVQRRAGRLLPRGFERDLAAMREPGDFVGITYYLRQSYRHALLVPLLGAREAPTPGARRSAMWEIFPEGLYRLLMRLKQEYGNPPVYITENGYPLPERPGADPLDDTERIEFLESHIDQALKARAEGADLRGYFVWSLLDNLEWELGYDMRFGLIRVDFATQKRAWRKSAYWYRERIRR
jgi:beta-glucosidase